MMIMMIKVSMQYESMDFSYSLFVGFVTILDILPKCGDAMLWRGNPVLTPTISKRESLYLYTEEASFIQSPFCIYRCKSLVFGSCATLNSGPA